MRELGKFNLKINVIPNGLKKYMSFSINKLSFIDSFQFLSSSFNRLVKNLNKDDFKYLSQEFDNNVLDLVKQKGFYLYEYMSNSEKFNEQQPSKEKFHSSLKEKKNSDKEYEHVLKTVCSYHVMYAFQSESTLYISLNVKELLALKRITKKLTNV